jgi:hypothetical protein
MFTHAVTSRVEHIVYGPAQVPLHNVEPYLVVTIASALHAVAGASLRCSTEERFIAHG